MRNRREFLELALSSTAFLALSNLAVGCGKKSSARRDDAGAPAAAGRPRYVVNLLLSGGHDTVYTTDPKTRGEVERDVDLPAAGELVEVGGLRLGPHFAALAPHAARMAVLNGVQVGTANHETGLKQFFRLKTNVSERMPTALDLIGEHRDGQPLPVAYMNVQFRVMHSPSYFGYGDRFYLGNQNLFDLLNEAEGSELEKVARALEREAASLARQGDVDAPTAATAAHMRQAAAFYDRTAGLPAFFPTQVSPDYTSQAMAEALQRTLWLLEHDLTPCVGVDLGLLGWDTHQRNADRQAQMSSAFVTHLLAFLDGLATRSNAHGRLIDQTLVLAGSDLGRFPRLNDMLGKDHLPQTSFLALGAGVRPGRFGGTDRRMAAVPVDAASGAVGKGSLLMLDDVGATLLRIAGLDPERYGYTGRTLEFLVAS